MNSRDFFEGLKSDGEGFREKVASAEHFIRLKKQAGWFGSKKTDAPPSPQFMVDNDDPINHPDNVKKINDLMDDHARRTYPHANQEAPLKDLHPSEWEASYHHAMAHPDLRHLHAQSQYLKEKNAKIFGASEPGEIEHASIPHEQRRSYYEDYLDTKKNEKPTGYLKSTLTGASVGAGLGALAGLATHAGSGRGGSGAALGGLGGAVAGGLTGALFAKADKDTIAFAKRVQPHQVDREMHRSIQRRSMEREARHEASTERRHQELMSKFGSSTTLRSRVMVAFEKRAMTGTTKALLGATGAGAALGAATTYLSSKPRSEFGGRSKDEDSTSRAVAENQNRPEEGLVRKIRNRSDELGHGLATAFREHPGKASAVGAAAGALTGYSVAKGLIAGGKAIAKRVL